MTKRIGYSNGAIIEVNSPGRACIIGEHVDNYGGQSLSCAINRYITITGRSDRSGKINIISNTLKDSFSVDLLQLETMTPLKNPTWPNYILGVIKEYMKRGYDVGSSYITIDSNLPSGGGVSSSAALELAVAEYLRISIGIDIGIQDIVEISRSAENNFVGVSCGFLDQISVAYGKKDHATLIDFKDLSVKHIPFDLADNIFLLIDSKEERNLAGTGYNKRKSECSEAYKVINNKYRKIKTLSDLKKEDLDKVEKILPSTLFKRVRHIITENNRVKKAVKYLKEGDISSMAALMFETHESLRFDYEVSTDRLNHIVDLLKDTEGVLGARLMGAGFGGSVIAIVKNYLLSTIKEKLSASYHERFGIIPEYLECIASNGTYGTRLPFAREKKIKEDQPLPHLLQFYLKGHICLRQE